MHMHLCIANLNIWEKKIELASLFIAYFLPQWLDIFSIIQLLQWQDSFYQWEVNDLWIILGIFIRIEEFLERKIKVLT